MRDVSGPRPLAAAFALVVSAAALAGPAAPAEDPSVLVSRALRARDAHDDAAAIRLLEEAVAAEPRPEWLGLLAETLAWEKDFARSESVYRRALAAAPSSRDLALGLGRVLLWQARYAEGRALLAGLVARDPRDADALEALALGEYWSGDYRSAERDFRRVLALRPDSPDSKKSLEEIASASRSAWEVAAGGLTDDQPYRTLGFRARVSLFSDPLTRWDVAAGAQALRAPGAAVESGDAPWGRLGVETVVPSARLTVSGWVEALRAPDGATLGLWNATLRRALGAAGALSLVADRRETFATRASLADHPNVTRAGLSWSWEARKGASAGADVFLLRFFDGNRGVLASAWLLWPLAAAGGFRLSAGPALSVRDTDESRFVLASASSAPDPSSGYRYSYTGAYVPYWAPVDLREARVAAVLEGPLLPGFALRLNGDAGWARDAAGGFGPDAGTSPVPPAPYTFTYARSFHPWRASATLSLDLGAGARLEAGYAHETTVYYRSDAFHASVVGHF
jgi:Tfp pilus assembly protein PilF